MTSLQATQALNFWPSYRAFHSRRGQQSRPGALTNCTRCQNLGLPHLLSVIITSCGNSRGQEENLSVRTQLRTRMRPLLGFLGDYPKVRLQGSTGRDSIIAQVIGQCRRSEAGGTRSPRMSVTCMAGRDEKLVRQLEGLQPLDDSPVKVKIAVGGVGASREEVFEIQRVLPPPSDIIVVTLPKPMGIVFEEKHVSDDSTRVVVSQLLRGSRAERAARVAQLFPPQGQGRRKGEDGRRGPLVGAAVLPGDVLRATTTVDVVVDFFGIRRPQRTIRFYATDGRRWEEVMGAIQASFVADGPLTLVFERRRTRE